MSTPTVFVIKNQAGQFLNKQQEWVDGGDRQALYRTAHRDEAVNTVFEVSSKDIYLRAEAIACPVDSKGQPLPQGADLLTQEEPSDSADNIEVSAEVADEQEASTELVIESFDEPGADETMAASAETADVNA